MYYLILVFANKLPNYISLSTSLFRFRRNFSFQEIAMRVQCSIILRRFIENEIQPNTKLVIRNNIFAQIF